MTVPTKILELVERFDRNLDAYKEGRYNETQIRREFIDPLFEELGWDIANKQGYAEAYKDVVHEETIKVGQATKALIMVFVSEASASFSGSQKTFRKHKGRYPSRLSTSPICMERQTSPQYPYRL